MLLILLRALYLRHPSDFEEVYINFLKSVLRLHILGYFTELWFDVMKNVAFGLESIFVCFVPLWETVSFACGTEINWGAFVTLIFVIQYFDF